MDYALEASGMLFTWNIDPIAAQAMLWTFWAIFGWLAVLWTIIWLAVAVFMIVASWKVFEKAWKPWRGILIPFYNIYLMFKIWGRPGRRFLWMLIPPVFVVLAIILNFDLAKRFGRHWTFGLWIRLVSIVFIPMIAFDKSITYTPKQ